MHGSTDGVWAEDASLPREILDSLRDLNRRFLDLLRGVDDYRWLPAHTLSPVQCEAVARCPYALFDLDFENAAQWQRLLGGAGQWRIADEDRAEPRVVEFTRLALFFAWHAVRVHSLSAQLTLGLPPSTVSAIRTASLARLGALVPGAALLLAPRWRHSAGFWDALYKAAASRDPSTLERVQQYGLQLAAAARLQAPSPS